MWTHLRRRLVHLLFGDALIDVCVVFGAGIADAAWSSADADSACHPVACNAGLDGWESAGIVDDVLPIVNHWVIGFPVSGLDQVPPAAQAEAV